MPQPQKKEPWTPFVRAPDAEVVGQDFEVWANNYYTVLKRQVPSCEASGQWPALIHLSIRRNDRQVIDDWRDKQRIKNLLVGRENEAVELYPAESRMVDGANQFHLWVISDPKKQFPFGYRTRLVSEDASVTLAGQGTSQQRRFDDDNRPDDLLNQDALDEAVEEYKRRGGKLP